MLNYIFSISTHFQINNMQCSLKSSGYVECYHIYVCVCACVCLGQLWRGVAWKLCKHKQGNVICPWSSKSKTLPRQLPLQSSQHTRTHKHTRMHTKCRDTNAHLLVWLLLLGSDIAHRDQLTVKMQIYCCFPSFFLCWEIILSQVSLYVGQLAKRLLWLDTSAPHIQTVTHAFPGGFMFPCNVLTMC